MLSPLRRFHFASRCCFVSSLLLLGGSAPLPGHAQDLVPRLELWRAKRAINTSLAQTASDAALNRKLSLSRSGSQPFWVVVAQIEPPVGKGATDPTPEIFEGSAPPAPRGIGVYTDFSMGFDKQSAVVDDPAPREVQIRRRIRILNISAEVPLARRTNLAVALPVISQSTRYRVGAGTFTQRGSGVGDLTLQLERRGRESARGVERAIALGLVLPTGKDPFNLSASQLPTGNGFYQPFVRLSTRKLRVPLQLFASVNYGKGLPRTVGGQRLRLPASYGGEVGFSYVIGPEFSVSTSVNANRVSSPLLLGPSQSVAYLSQSLSYNANEVTVLRASVDVGLTDDSTDAFAGLSLRRAF